jgi:hypothetical protein
MLQQRVPVQAPTDQQKKRYGRAAIIDPEQTVAEQLQDERYIEMRTEMSEQYIDMLRLPPHADTWIPGYRLITIQLAREAGLMEAAQVDLPDIPFDESNPDAPTPASGAVVGNLLEAFVDGLSGQQKYDVLNSTLLAQLAANTRANRRRQPVQWSNAYTEILMNTAWVMPNFQFRDISSSANSFTIDRAVLQLLRGILTGSEMEIARQAIEAVKALEDEDRRFVIFERTAVENNVGNFQLDTCGVSQGGSVTMKLGAFGFQTRSNVTRLLWFSFPGVHTRIQAGRNSLVLNDQVYDRLRDAILNKLGDRGLAYVGGLVLSEDPIE